MKFCKVREVRGIMVNKSRKQIVIMIVLVIIICFQLVVVGKNNNRKVASGIVEFSGEGKYWSATFIFDSDRYEETHTNYFRLVSKEKTLIPKEDIDIKIVGTNYVITGNLGDMDVSEKINDDGFQEILFLVGTVNQETFFKDKYKFHIEFQEKVDTVNLKHKKSR